VNVTPQVLTAEERALIITVARCELIWQADQEDAHPCHAVVGSQDGADEYDRQVPEAWAGNLHGSRLVFLSSNPSISETGSGRPLDTAEDYPRASSTDTRIIEFLGRRFDQTLPTPFVKNGRYLQQNGHYAQRATRFWASVQRRPKHGGSRVRQLRPVWLARVRRTSVASPIIASVYALANNASSETAGSLYGASLNRVTSGTNTRRCSTYLCNAADSLSPSGYNGPTENGTPNGTSGF
jgi:hypothetical protein